MNKCSACGNDIISPYGPKESPVLLIGARPGEEEMKRGRPFVGATGNVLRNEMGRFGLDIYQFRMTNVWLHFPTEDAELKQTGWDAQVQMDLELKQACWEAHVQMALEEAVGRKAIFLMGSACARAFLDGGIMEWSGLELRPKLLSAPVVMCGPNPALVFQSSESYTPPWGEVTWSIQRFAEILERDGIL